MIRSISLLGVPPGRRDLDLLWRRRCSAPSWTVRPCAADHSRLRREHARWFECLAPRSVPKASSLVILARQIYHKEGLLGWHLTRGLISLEARGAGSIEQPSMTPSLEHRGRSDTCARTVRCSNRRSDWLSRIVRPYQGVSLHAKKKGDIGAKQT
jgi:hypothetical protein